MIPERLLLATLFCVVLCGGCSQTPEGPAPSLPAPVLLPPPSDYDVDEPGLDAIPESDAIQVQWQRYPEKNAELLLYRSRGLQKPFTTLAALPAQDSLYIDESVAIGQRYWYFLTARLEGHRDSPSSDTLSYKLLAKPFALTETSSNRPRFRWQAPETPLEYVLKLFDASTDKKVWLAIVSPDYGSLAEEVTFDFDGSALLDSLETGKAYRWRVDVVAPERNAGAESNWRVFICP